MRTPAVDTAAAAWLQGRLAPWPEADGGVRVRSLVPPGFDAYARIFHPACSWNADRGTETRVRWSDVAASTGRAVHPLMEWHRIAARLPGSDWPAWEHGEPVEGEFPEDQIRLLAVALREFTATPERCWFCLWVGFGGIEEDGAQVRLPGREYTLSSGVIEAITSFHFGPVWQTPQLWWPDDHVWYVASDIDLKSTYLGASSACVDALLPSGELEVLRTSADARVDIEADTVNRE